MHNKIHFFVETDYVCALCTFNWDTAQMYYYFIRTEKKTAFFLNISGITLLYLV